MKGGGNLLTTISDYFINISNEKKNKKTKKKRNYNKKKKERNKTYRGQSSGVYADIRGSPTTDLHDKYKTGGKKTLKKSKKVKKSRKNRK